MQFLVHLAVPLTVALTCCLFCCAPACAQGGEDEPANQLLIPPDIPVGDDLDQFSLNVYRINDADLDTIQFNICHDEETLEVLDVDLPSSLDLEFTDIELFDDAVHVALVRDSEAEYTFLETDRRSRIATITYGVSEERPSESTLEFCDGVTDPETEVLFIDTEGNEISPETSGSTLTFPGPTFLRTDCDGDGSPFALLDALFILNYGFLGGDDPPCMDAADADDDGRVLPLLEALYVLRHAFTSGPAAPTPGSTQCGVDPTEDDLDCDLYEDCPTYW